MLNIGDPAPDFILPWGERSLSLESFKGKWLVLYFYPKDDTPGCTKQACAFRDNYTTLQKKNVEVIGISKDSVPSHQAFIEKYSLPFPLLSDPDLSICQAYGVWVPKSLYGKTFLGIDRSTFLINPEGKIHKIWRKVRVLGHVEKVLESLS